MSKDVHAPYHFVPLSKWVHMPDWAHQVSHDVPFSDGLSGTIDLTLETISPLCVGGEQVSKQGEPTIVKWVKNPAGVPVIPGSSLKGMLRSVLEVASFGKFQAVDEYRGVARKPRATYKHSVHDYIDKRNKAHLSDAVFDMAELVFGSLREQGLGLKGRVGFTDAEPSLDTAHKLYVSNPVILNGPKPSFYPAYLEQKAGSLVDYNSEQTSISGWKRYVAKVPTDELLAPIKQDIKNNVSSKLELLPSGTQFKGRLTFHNLRPVELGALIWSIELGNDKTDKRAHSLGHGKPLGAGLVKLQAKVSIARQEGSESRDYTAYFEHYMNEMHPGSGERSWFSSPQLQYLRALTAYDDNEGVDTSYMSIDNKEYQTAKNALASLPSLHGIERSEKMGLIQNEPAMRAFGQGRLAGLIDEANGWEVSRQADANHEANREANVQAKQAELAAMSPCEVALKRLKETLEAEQLPQNHPEPMRVTAQAFLDNADSYSQASADVLYKLLRQHEFHKKPKKRVKEHKALLSELSETFKLTES